MLCNIVHHNPTVKSFHVSGYQTLSLIGVHGIASHVATVDNTLIILYIDDDITTKRHQDKEEIEKDRMIHDNGYRYTR